MCRNRLLVLVSCLRIAWSYLIYCFFGVLDVRALIGGRSLLFVYIMTVGDVETMY